MNRPGLRTTLAAAAILFGLGCEDREFVTAPEGLDVRFAPPTCPGHPSCKDGPAPAGDATVELAGDMTTSSAQPVVLSKDSKNFLAGSGGGEDFTIVDALDLFAAAGSPSSGALGGCVTDPADLDAGAVQRLIDRLTDAEQSRTFRFTVDRKDPSNMSGRINQSWFDDGDQRQYRTRVTESSLRPGHSPVVTSPAPDVYVYTQGSIVSWDMATDEALACPNGGSVTLTLDR